MTKPFANPLLATPDRPLPRAVAIIGAGTIGPDIGYYLKSAIPGLKLYLVDVNQKAVESALLRFAEYSRKAVARGKMSEAEAKDVIHNLYGTMDYADIADADWVIEAATENLPLKRKIFAQIEAVVRPDALITSNTSSLPAELIFSQMKHPARATVTHFFAPAWRNPAVEVIRWEKTDPAVVEYLRWAFCMTGKVPLVTADVACFMLDRIFDNWCNESAMLLDRATAAEVDSVASEFVHAGPFFVLNLAHGNPIITETNTLQAEMEGAHYDPAPIFKSVETWVTVPPGKKVEVAADTAQAIRQRLLGILFSQSVDIVDRKIGDPADLDLGCRLALGFKQGPLDLMRTLGEQTTGQALIRLRSERAGMPMPTRPFDAYQGFLRHILVDDLGDVKLITLRRPEAMNALHDEMNDEILSVIRRFENDPAVAGFVITGYGTKAFCAGGDIGRFVDMLGDADASAQYARDCSRLLVHLDRMKKPVVAALNGIALGGGFELAYALPQHRRLEARLDPDARSDTGHHPRHRRHGRALPSLAARRADLQRHAAHRGAPEGDPRPRAGHHRRAGRQHRATGRDGGGSRPRTGRQGEADRRQPCPDHHRSGRGPRRQRPGAEPRVHRTHGAFHPRSGGGGELHRGARGGLPLLRPVCLPRQRTRRHHRLQGKAHAGFQQDQVRLRRGGWPDRTGLQWRRDLSQSLFGCN
jgi:enoyl-CoA hydratase/3-hydroxyacyl-CoA dehydrogenase